MKFFTGLTAALFSLVLLTPSAAALQAPRASEATSAERLIEIGLNDNRVRTHLDALIEGYGPRLTGSLGLTRASEWARKRFADMGLKASLEEWGEFPMGFERGPSYGRLIGADGEVERELMFVTDAWTAGTAGPARGQVVLEPTTLEGLEASAFAGKWILGRSRKDRAKASVRNEVRELLNTAGVLGYLRSGGTNPTVGGRYKVALDELPKVPSVKLFRSEFESLTEQLSAENAVSVELEFLIDNRFVVGPIKQYNVIADIVGSEFPDEYVIVGGHIDSWDCAPGAQDNGTGVATTLEAARMIMAAGIQPKRTIRFMLWGGEEQGLLGSGSYARAHPEVCAKTSAVLVHDGGGNYLGGISGPPALIGDLRSVFEPLMELNQEMPFTVVENKGLRNFGSSDHASFVAQGVPGFFWDQRGELDYDYIHHTVYDHTSEVNDAYQEHSAIVVAVGAVGIANLDHMLDRTDLIRARTSGNRRLMGVYLEENLVTGLVDGGQAEKLKLMDNDLIISVDGVTVASREEIVSELNKGEPHKTVVVQRGSQKLEVVFAWEAKK